MMIFPLFCFCFLFFFFPKSSVSYSVPLPNALLFIEKTLIVLSGLEHTRSHLHILMFPHRTFSGADPRELLSAVEEGTLQEPWPGKG